MLGKLWALSPDVRLGQLMAHLGFLGEVHVGPGLGDIDDDELLAVMYRHHAELKARVNGLKETVAATSATISVSGSTITDDSTAVTVP